MDNKKENKLYIKIEAVTKAINDLLGKHGLRFVIEHSMRIVPIKKEE